MWLFWGLAGLLAAAAATLVVFRAARAAKAAAVGGEDPALGVYKRQLGELDDLRARGLLGEEEHRAAYAESGRRLLTQSGRSPQAERAGGTGPRLAVLGAALAAAVAALGLYLALGSPGFRDQPFQSRLRAWKASDPRSLSAAELAAVLRDVVAGRPGDAEGHEFLGRAQLASNQPIEAADSFRAALRLSPRRADLEVLLGEALAAAADGSAAPPEAEAAFRRALAIEPGNVAARYFVARGQVAGGDRQAGLAAWRALAAELPADDPRRPAIEADIERATGPAALAPGAAVPADPAAQAAFIRGMVAGLAARLEKAPDDPQGWARLVRAYRVLGDREAVGRSLERARRLFAGRPADLSRIEAEARAPAAAAP